MGMFDSVMAECPNCEEKIEFQSKAGACDLKKYHFTNVPAEIAKDLVEEVGTCKNCEGIFILSANIPRISMIIKPVNQADPYD